MRLILILALASTSNLVAAAEQEIRSACSLAASTEVTLPVKVVSGKDACMGRRCFASIYNAVLSEDVPPELTKGQTIFFTTSASIQIGSKYTLFAEKVGEERTIVFRGAGYEETYEVPEAVGFYVPIDGAFLVAGGSSYRTVWPGCDGEVSECATVRALDGKDILKAEVLVKDVERAGACRGGVGASKPERYQVHFQLP